MGDEQRKPSFWEWLLVWAAFIYGAGASLSGIYFFFRFCKEHSFATVILWSWFVIPIKAMLWPIFLFLG